MLVSRFLVERLENAGVKHVFGYPGEYTTDLYKELQENKKIGVINNTDENHAGFAADAYARAKGIGCVVVTCSVGASKVINAVQCAYAERSPMVVVAGSPGMDERAASGFMSQKAMFDEITCASVVLDNPVSAGFQIDQAFESLRHFKRPIYIELPRDVAKKAISYDVYKLGTPAAPDSDPENLEEALREVREWLQVAEQPIILAGVELARYGLGDDLLKFAKRSKIPVATTLLSKSVISESEPLFAGIYAGGVCNLVTRELVEQSDCLLMFGVMLSDLTLCFKPSKALSRNTVVASVDGLKVKNHTFTGVQFKDFCLELFKSELTQRDRVPILPAKKTIASFKPVEGPITTRRLFEKIDSILTDKIAVIADVGDAMLGAAELTVQDRDLFYCPAFYSSMGSAIPGALGVQMAMPEVRPLVLVGDGGFQMSCSELSTILDRKLHPIILVLNDGAEGDMNLRTWDYHLIVQLMKGGQGRLVKTESDLEVAMKEALDSKELFVINVCLAKADVSDCLKRMTQALGKKL